PLAMIFLRNRTRIFSFQDSPDTLLDDLESLPVAARRHGVRLFTILPVRFRVPRTASNPLDQVRGDAIALHRERVVGVRYIRFLDALELGGCGSGAARRVGTSV